jgi:hypothetical protein
VSAPQRRIATRTIVASRFRRFQREQTLQFRPILVLAVTPGVIFFPFGFRAFGEIDMISMGFAFPSGVETYFGTIPHMIVIVIGVVIGNARRASGDEYG